MWEKRAATQRETEDTADSVVCLLLNQITPNEEQDVSLNELIHNMICSIFPHCSDESENNTVMNNNEMSFIIKHDYTAD